MKFHCWGIKYTLEKNKAFGSVLTDPISSNNTVIPSPCLNFPGKPHDIHQQMQQVDSKEGFVKEGVYSCASVMLLLAPPRRCSYGQVVQGFHPIPSSLSDI